MFSANWPNCRLERMLELPRLGAEFQASVGTGNDADSRMTKSLASLRLAAYNPAGNQTHEPIRLQPG
jgi:hypothetical protein